MKFGWDLGECSLKITYPIIFGICEDQKSSTVCQMVGGGSKQGAKDGILIYMVWNLWKERNRRIFENERKTVQQVASLTKEDIMQRRRAVSFDG